MAGYRLHPIYSNRLGLLQNVEQIANLVKQFGNCLDREIKGSKNYAQCGVLSVGIVFVFRFYCHLCGGKIRGI
jgi:hypothetical protein